MKKINLLVILVCISFSVLNAQPPKTYDQTQREKETKAYNDAYLEALKYNSNSSTSSNGVDAKAAQELANLFASRKGKETPEQKAAKQKQAAEAYVAEEKERRQNIESSYEKYKAEAKIEDRVRKPIVKQYMDAGFDYFEAYYFSNANVDMIYSSGNLVECKYVEDGRYFDLLLGKKEFDQKFETASFEELFLLINEFKLTGYTALKSLNKLRTRFPEKSNVLDVATFDIMAGYWKMDEDFRTPSYYLTTNAFGENPARDYMLDTFEDIYNKQPAFVFDIASKIRMGYYENPFRNLAWQYEKKKKEKKQLKFLALHSQYLLTQMKKPLVYEKSIGLELQVILDKIERMEITLQDVKEIAAANKLTPIDVIAYFANFYYAPHYNTMSMLSRTNYGYVFEDKSYFKDSRYDKMLKQLAKEEDVDALNCYALRVAAGLEKENKEAAIDMWKKSSDAGSVYALYNLVVATTSIPSISSVADVGRFPQRSFGTKKTGREPGCDDDQRERQQHQQRRHGIDLGRDRDLDHRINLQRQRHRPGAGGEKSDHEIVD